jgi:hypothetical protein
MQRIYVSLKSSDSNKRDKEAMGRQSRRSKALSIGKRKATEERTIKNCRARGSPFRLPLLIRDLFLNFFFGYRPLFLLLFEEASCSRPDQSLRLILCKSFVAFIRGLLR